MQFPRNLLKPDNEYPNELPSIKIDNGSMVKASQFGQPEYWYILEGTKMSRDDSIRVAMVQN